MRDVRETLGLPPVDPDTERRFGPPTYTENQVKMYAAALQAQVDELREALEPFSSAYDQIVADHGLDWFPDEGVAVRSALAYPVANASVVWRHFRLASEATKAALSQPPADEAREA